MSGANCPDDELLGTATFVPRYNHGRRAEACNYACLGLMHTTPSRNRLFLAFFFWNFPGIWTAKNIRKQATFGMNERKVNTNAGYDFFPNGV